MKITPRNTNSFNAHIREITKQDVLSISEQDILAEQALSGCAVSRESLISSNLRLAITVAKRYNIGLVEFEDLVSVANLGLVLAIETYDPTKGSTFPSWAQTYMARELIQHLSANGHTVRLSKYSKALGLEPLNLRSLGDAAGLTDDNAQTFEDIIQGDQDTSVEDNDHLANLKQVLLNNISKLKPRHQQVIKLHYLEGYTLAEIGQITGRTREAVRVQKDVALTKLKEFLQCTSQRQCPN